VPIPAQSIRVILHASQTSGEELQTGYWIAIPTPVDQAGLDSLAAELAGYANVMLNAIASQIYSSVTWDRLDLYYYPAGGPHAGMQSTHTLSSVGLATAAGPALDTCGVVTLETGRPGRSYRGRMYLPWHVGIPGGVEFDGSTVTTRLDAVKAMLDSVNTGRGHAVSVMSSARGSNTPVTGISMDTIPDVQRRRVNKLPATRRREALA
jgi:hypothetical protein